MQAALAEELLQYNVHVSLVDRSGISSCHIGMYF